ncbi:MAG: hypothetical protein K0R29_3002 [Pseudobdellovibrio sp.]|jgi:hypothetical protein|nr:hypothetical protein [Pseudobdellovibrio sp.]
MQDAKPASTGEADLEIKKAAQLSITEIGLGSVGHGFKIPLTGHVLSLNQLGFLLNAVNQDGLPRSAAFEISSISAILKSFSPAGKKIGPMLSIAMQGFLFWLSLSVIGMNIVGQVLGAVLLSLWAFVQPLVTLFLIYGFDLVRVGEFYVKRISEDYAFLAVALIYAFSFILALKIILAIAMVILSLKYNKKIIVLKTPDRLEKQIKLSTPVNANQSAAKSAVKDMLRPIFLLSFILMMIFIWQVNGDMTEKIWWSMRPLAIAFCLFYILRSPWVAEKLFSYSKRSPAFAKVYEKSRKAFEIVSEKYK